MLVKSHSLVGMAGLVKVWIAILVASEAADADTYSCYNDLTRCVGDFRKLLVDTDMFWFGNNYESYCPSMIRQTAGCANADGERRSILSRLLSWNDTTDRDRLNQTASSMSLANITYNVPAGNYTGCGQEYQVPAVTNLLVDPVATTYVSAWSLSHDPMVTWTPLSQSSLHVLVIWDPGNFYLHGLYINCNSSMDSCTMLRPYLGPLNAHLRANTYIFAIYQQTGPIDVVQSARFIEGNPLLLPAKFVATFIANDTVPVSAGIMTIVADPYSVQKISDRFYIVNNCPYLISQLDVFHSVVNASGLSVAWSNDTVTQSLYRRKPFLTSLTTNIDVTYSLDEDYTIESCCKNYSLTRGVSMVNPFTNRTLRPGNIQFKPRVHLTPVNIMSPVGIAGESYTLFLLDVAAALLPNAQEPVYITHWLVTNIRNADVNTGDTVAPYFGPNPFTPNDHRPYIFLLFRQPVPQLNKTLISKFCPNGTLRCRTQLKPVLQAWNLTEIVGLTWFLAEQDAFAVYRLYEVIRAMTKDTACQNIPGYASKCPSACPVNSQINSNINNNNHGVIHSINIPLLALICLAAIWKHKH